MRDQNTEDGNSGYDYSPNQLVHLSIDNLSLYKRIVESNLDEDDSVEEWEQRNMDNTLRYSGNYYPLHGLDGQ